MLGQIKLTNGNGMTKIKCRTKGIVIDTDGHAWPCCWTLTEPNMSPYIKSLDKDWNSIAKNGLDAIIDSEAFSKHFNTEGWETNPDPICKKFCKAINNEHKTHKD